MKRLAYLIMIISVGTFFSCTTENEWDDVFPIDDLCDTYEESRKYYRSYNFAKNLLILKCRV